jgi:hypothetical protein
MNNNKTEIYISVDVEADGPIPGPNSMLSFGAVALTDSGREFGHFSANLETLEGASGNPATMDWWKTQPEAWMACRADVVPPAKAMPDFVAWVKSLGGRPVFVGFPASYDFMFVYWYMIKFAGESPFSHSALDMKTMTMVLRNIPFREATKRNMPRDWFPKGLPHNHVALDDAREQGQLFISMLKAARNLHNS